MRAVDSRPALTSLQWRVAQPETIRRLRAQNALFNSTYEWPVKRRMEELRPAELRMYLARFVRFKSMTDPRVRSGLPAPVLDADGAAQLATDILSVSEFFSLPLDFFLGIGAMENNFMNVRGDIGHAVWKGRAQEGDVVLRRHRGRVLVLNESSGVWQITQQTLRFAHRLTQKDSRDYGTLPSHLRPPRDFHPSRVIPEVLTTYAGVLLRDLLDRFGGEVLKAVGAYNGGPARPNLVYASGVERAARHARSIVEQAAALNGIRVAETAFVTAPALGKRNN